MITHYVSTALRHFRRHKVTSGINLACLALGLTCFMVIYAIVDYYGRADRQFTKSDRTYVVTQQIHWAGSETTTPTSPNTAWPVADYLRDDAPELEVVARVSKGRELPAVAGERREFLQVAFSDARFFQVFDFELLEGDIATALREPHSIVLTHAAAQKLFGARRALGESILLNSRERVYVTGVLAPLAGPSHMSFGDKEGLKPQSFEALASQDVFLSIAAARGQSQASLGQWTNNNAYYTYAVVPANGTFSIAQLNERLHRLARHVPRDQGSVTYAARPVSEIFELSLNMVVGTDRTGVSSMSLLSLLALLVLCVSCLNYANLATAQAATRSKEMALARTVGARAGHVVAQALTESALATLTALILALAAMLVLSPLLERAFDMTDMTALFASTAFWGDVVLVVGGVSAVSCLYPALTQTRIRPAGALRNAAARRSGGRLTTTLVALQFAAASLLLICVLVMRAQNDRLQQSAHALSQGEIVVLTSDPSQAGIDRDVLRAELEREPGVAWVTGMGNVPWSLNISSQLLAASPEAGARRWLVWREPVDYDFFEVLDARVLAGRTFKRELGDATRPVVVIDAALAEQYGWSPAEAIGKSIYTPVAGTADAATRPSEVIGVIEPKALQSVGLGLSSTLYRLNPERANVLLIGIGERDVAGSLAAIDRVWQRLAPDVPLKRTFMDEQFDSGYRAFTRFVAAFETLALFAFTISVFGLTGMALHLAHRRTHEIGVRKALGASASRVLAMLLRDLAKPVFYANLAVWPLAFIAMQLYLSVFIERAELTGVPFFVSLAITLGIAWLAVLAHALRAARVQPARVLRYE